MRCLRRATAFTLQLLFLQLTLLGGRGACEGMVTASPAAASAPAAMHQRPADAPADAMPADCDHDSPSGAAPAPASTADHQPGPPAPCHNDGGLPAHCVSLASCSAATVTMPSLAFAPSAGDAHRASPSHLALLVPITWRRAPEPPPPRV